MLTVDRAKTVIDRRRFRRTELNLPVSIRSLSSEDGAANPVIGQVQDIGLAGVYCYVAAPCSLKPDEPVICSVAVSPEQQRIFPFARLQGKGWVLRVGTVTRGRRAGESPTDESLVGVAIAFAPDVTALGASGVERVTPAYHGV